MHVLLEPDIERRLQNTPGSLRREPPQILGLAGKLAIKQQGVEFLHIVCRGRVIERLRRTANVLDEGVVDINGCIDDQLVGNDFRVEIQTLAGKLLFDGGRAVAGLDAEVRVGRGGERGLETVAEIILDGTLQIDRRQGNVVEAGSQQGDLNVLREAYTPPGAGQCGWHGAGVAPL